MSFEQTFAPLMLGLMSVMVAGVMTNKTALKSDLSTINMNRPPDFIMYYNGANIVKKQGVAALYDYQVQKDSWDRIVSPYNPDPEGLLGFRAPPIVAVSLKPLADLSYTNAFFVLVATNILVISLIIVSIRYTNTVDSHVWKRLLLALPLFLPIWININGGQISAWILLFITLAYLFISRDNLFLGGFLLGLLMIKPQYLNLLPLIIALYLGHKQLKRLLLGLILSLLMLVLVNVGLYGIDFLTDYPAFVLASENLSYGTNHFFNYNISSLLSLIFEQQTQYVIAGNLLINSIFYGSLLFYLIKNNKHLNRDLAFAAVIMFGPLINMHTMSADLVVFLLPVYLVSSYFYLQNRPRQMYLSASILLLLPWAAYSYFNFITTLVFFMVGYWILKESFGGDGGNRTRVLKA